MAKREYVASTVRDVKGKNPKTGRTVHKAWKGVAKYKIPNTSFVERPQGEDTRTPAQKRPYIWKQVAKTFDASAVKTRAQANKALQAWVDELNADEETHALPSATTTVGEYVASYIDMLETAGSVRPSAIADYRTSCKRITEGMGDVLLRDLKPAVIQAWEGDLLKAGKGVNTVLKYHRLLNSVCKHAVAVHDLDWNPCSAVVKPRRVTPSPNSLTAEQHARLVATLAAMGPTPVVTAAGIASYTGLREGEICGLTWGNYDRDAGIIRVRRAIAKAGGKKYVTTPKTEASRRDVPVHPDLAVMLERRRDAMLNELSSHGVNLSPAAFNELYVCGDAFTGKYLDNTVLSRSWKSLADAFELDGTQGRRLTFHDLRHSFATRAIAEGADVKSVAAVLGHADCRVTLNVYADADKESKRRAVSLMGAGIAAQGDVKPFEALAQ